MTPCCSNFQESSLLLSLSHLLCYTSSVLSPASPSFILCSFNLPPSHSLFAHSHYLPHFNFVSIPLDLLARLSHKQQDCHIVCTQKENSKEKPVNAFWIYIHVCVCIWRLLVNEGSECLHIHLLFLSIHSVLLHIIPPSVPPILPIKSPPRLLPVAEDEEHQAALSGSTTAQQSSSAPNYRQINSACSQLLSASASSLWFPSNTSPLRLIIHNFTVQPQSGAAAWSCLLNLLTTQTEVLPLQNFVRL